MLLSSSVGKPPRRAVTSALFRAYCGIHWTLPPPHLTPPLPQRLNYVLWVSDLVARALAGGVRLVRDTTPGELEHLRSASHGVHGLDVGCGASAVFELLGCSYCGWRVSGSDIDPAAVSHATELISANSLEGHLQVRLSPPDADLLSHCDSPLPPSTALSEAEAPMRANAYTQAKASLGQGAAPELIPIPGACAGSQTRRWAFSMCNPPFFAASSEAGANPRTEFAGTESELATEGGELGFVMRLVEASVARADEVAWFTTMAGKRGTARAIVQHLRTVPGVTAVESTTFFQGSTLRWGVAWSFCAGGSMLHAGAFSAEAFNASPAPLLRQEGNLWVSLDLWKSASLVSRKWSVEEAGLPELASRIAEAVGPKPIVWPGIEHVPGRQHEAHTGGWNASCHPCTAWGACCVLAVQARPEEATGTSTAVAHRKRPRPGSTSSSSLGTDLSSISQDAGFPFVPFLAVVKLKRATPNEQSSCVCAALLSAGLGVEKCFHEFLEHLQRNTQRVNRFWRRKKARAS